MSTPSNNRLLALLLVAVMVVIFLLTQTPLGSFLASSPWWVYFVIAGILLSGYLSVKYTIEDRKTDQEWIENEGEAFLERVREKRAVEQKED